jgi:hypothetical protein
MKKAGRSRLWAKAEGRRKKAEGRLNIEDRTSNIQHPISKGGAKPPETRGNNISTDIGIFSWVVRITLAELCLYCPSVVCHG